ncbi:nucleotidyl transferase AbiEii/AbiGii toxin family protein [Deinococcus maricopensis]|uniref:Uncharacterized protein n=1 Tax=Deinococcus maricopensis (strain DSM 21211 / LMG 22137 / NRRL B-23946 / LB-34) TaxID=709986 RepID=E8U8X3_DEIML|nr:nucleotidyl transferase AbiEii/AbiGii toxin family protein [Deinococcus maricopensis]ADV67512.1 Domain of unknown function DUF1814 [Deinococcus maricopensis DSM 21211]
MRAARPDEAVRPLLLGWLRRAGHVPEAAALVLRGSLVTGAYCGAGRAAADVDYLVMGAFDAAAMHAVAERVVAVPDARTALRLVSTEVIWAETAFPGLRAHVAGDAGDGVERTFQVDFAFGDPMTQAPTRLTLPGVGPVQACAPETLWAWKLHGLVEFGPGRWRAKDLYDLQLLDARVALDAAELRAAVEVAFQSRGATFADLTDLLTRAAWGCSASNRRKWRAFERRYGVSAEFLAVRDAVHARVASVVGPAVQRARR